MIDVLYAVLVVLGGFTVWFLIALLICWLAIKVSDL